MSEVKDVRLKIEIKNKEPLELMELTKSLVSLASQFESYILKNADSSYSREAKLLVKEIKTGSVILDLVELATVGVIPFVENINTIIGFGEYCKKAFDSILKGKDKGKDLGLTISDIKDFSQIVNPIAKDGGSQLNISSTVNGTVELHLHINSLEANAFQNIAKAEIEKLITPEQIDEVKTKVLLYLWQARDMKSSSGNKGIIDDLYKGAVNLIFETEEIKESILNDGSINPFTKAFVVDVKILTTNNKISAYKIVKFHESFDK